MIDWIRRIFCRHDWQDGMTDGVEKFYWCGKCGKSEVRRLSDLY